MSDALGGTGLIGTRGPGRQPLSSSAAGVAETLHTQRPTLRPARPPNLSDVTTIVAHQVLDENGGPPSGLWLLLSGWACRRRTLRDGRRQILSLILPGECLTRNTGGSDLVFGEAVALTSLSLIDAAKSLSEGEGALAANLENIRQNAAFVQQALLLNHIVRLGRLSAKARVAHLLLELHDRLNLSGLVDDRSYRLPLNQATLGDFIGLSIVHVNRVLQQLRREGLINLAAGKVTVLSRAGLVRLSDYEAMPSFPPLLKDPRAPATQTSRGR
jgi:CRP-like cAMP-binding protein